MRSFPNLLVREVDGCDPLASLGVLREAVAWCRARRGPALVHARVIRPYSHSLSDDEALYRAPAERERDARQDPLVTFPLMLQQEGLATAEELVALRAEIDREVNAAADAALAAPAPSPESATDHVYSMTVDPTSEAFATEPVAPGRSEDGGRPPERVPPGRDGARSRASWSSARTWPTAAGRRASAWSRARAESSRSPTTSSASSVPTGSSILPSPRPNIVGRAIGMATRGLKPVVEIQFLDYIWPAYMQIRNELALIRWRSSGAFHCPLVIRVTYGGYLQGGAVYHSQCGEVLFTHIPGLRVVIPSNAEDANGLLRTAIRADDPVLFLEHKHLYRQAYNKGRYPGPDYMIPFGRARLAREGRDLTVVTFGALVQRSLVAAKQVESDGIRTEVLDLRSLSPYDWEAIATERAQDGQGDRGPRGQPLLGLRRGDRGPDRRRALRRPGCAGAAGWARSTPSWATPPPSRTPSCPRSRPWPTRSGSSGGTEDQSLGDSAAVRAAPRSRAQARLDQRPRSAARGRLPPRP